MFLYLFGLFITPTDPNDGPILTNYTSYDVFPHNDVPFEGFFDAPPHLGVKSPKKTPKGA